MKEDKTAMPLHIRLKHLENVIGGERFLKKQGIGSEVPFFICPYKPEESVDMERLRGQLIKILANKSVKVLDINLYDISVEILKKEGAFERIMEIEESIEKDQLKELLQGVLDPENYLVPAISTKMKENVFDVLFLSGAGEVFPYLRTHSVLNNLQSVANEKPTLIFFPGFYTYSESSGTSLDLFGRLHNDRYYRAFNIYHFEE